MIWRLFARRYLFSRNSRSVINIISGVSVVAVAVPVAAMIILLSVFNGFESLVKQLCSAYDADITVSPATGTAFETAALDDMAIAGTEGVGAVSFVLEQGALLEYKGNQATATIRGIDGNYAAVMPVEETVQNGRFRVQLGEDVNEVILGQGLAYALGVHSFVVDDVTVYALKRSTFSTLLPMDGYSAASFPISGTFTIDAETDRNNAITSLRAAQKLFNYPDKATALLVRTDDGADATKVKRGIERIAGDGFKVQTRDERNATLYRIMRYEKWGIFLISLMVLVIASFSIVGSLVMLIIDKREDICTLRAMGADTRLVRRIFTAEGMMICGIGGAAGLAAGIALCLIQQRFGLITIPAESFLTDEYPVRLCGTDIAAVGISFILTAWCISAATVAAMIPRERK